MKQTSRSISRLIQTHAQPACLNPQPNTYASLLQTCVHISPLKQIHDQILLKGLHENIYLATKLVNTYAMVRSVEDACQVFDKMSDRVVFSWNVMIRAYADAGFCDEALGIYYEMQGRGVEPDRFTFPSVLKACGDLEEGRRIHHHVEKLGYECDVFVGTSLVAMYVNCGRIEDARLVFDKMPQRTVVTCSSMSRGCAQSGEAAEALRLFRQMQVENLKPNSVMIAGYAQNGLYNDALVTFHQMQEANVKPSKITFLSVLPACAKLASFQQGKNIHTCIMVSGFGSDAAIMTALIDMYAKCGSIDIAHRLFDQISERNVVTWNAIIDAYGMHGHGKDALALFFQMQQTGVKPDHITFVCVLSACSHAGLVDEGWKHFNSMLHDHDIAPRREHYACMVDLLGRAGYLYKAYGLIRSMPFETSASILRALLSACKIHGNIQLGKHVADWLSDIHQENAGHHVLLSNIYAAAGRWEAVTTLRTMMKDRRWIKTPGRSSIELNSSSLAYHQGESHPNFQKCSTFTSLAT